MPTINSLIHSSFNWVRRKSLFTNCSI